MRFKQSFFNINVYEEGYTDNPAYRDLYYNTMSGQFAEISLRTPLNRPDLIKKGMVVPTNTDEPAQYKQRQEQAIHDDFPKSVFLTICVSMACNYDCAYCFEGCKQGKNMQGIVLNDTVDYIKSEIDRNTNIKEINIRWFGGEPLLNVPAIECISKEIIPYCEKKGIKYRAIITTNGYYFTKDVSERLKELKVESAQIALDGFEQTYISTRKAPKNAFRRVLQNISDSVIPVAIRMNTTRQNKDEILELVKELYRSKSVVLKDQNHISISRVKEYTPELAFGFTDAEWLAFRENLPKFETEIGMKNLYDLGRKRLIPCSHNQRRNVVITPDGYLYRCDFQMHDKNNSIGTLTKGITDGNATDKDFVKSTVTEDCLSCKFLPICCGGLCRYAELINGKPCELTKGRFKQNMTNYLKYVYREKAHRKEHSSLLDTKCNILS